MKHFNYFCAAVLLALVVVALPSCGEDEPRQEPKVTLAPGASTDIVLGFQDVMETGAVVFNSTSDWSAEILPANSSFEIVGSKSLSQVSWLEINPYTGGPGEIRATLFATPNHSAGSRYAVVRINSVTNQLVFKVTQKGMPASDGGDKPTPNPGE